MVDSSKRHRKCVWLAGLLSVSISHFMVDSSKRHRKCVWLAYVGSHVWCGLCFTHHRVWVKLIYSKLSYCCN